MKNWNQIKADRIKAGGAALALGICISAALVQPTSARSEDEKPMGNAPTHKPGGANGHEANDRNGGPNHDGPNHDGRPPMRPEEMMADELDLTDAQKTKVQAIMEQEREQMRAIHEKTRSSITALLNADQKAKFAKMPQPGPGNGPRGERPGGPNGGGRPMRPEDMNDEDHGRPVELIARDLGVTPEQFREAFKKVQPAARGERPTEAQLQNNHKVLTEALGVSIEKLDAVMDKYRPEGPDGPPRRQ